VPKTITTNTPSAVSFDAAMSGLSDAVQEIMDADPRVQSIGIGRYESGFGYRAVRNVARILPASARVRPVDQVRSVPVIYRDSGREIDSLVRLPTSGPGSPGVTSFVPEQTMHRHLVCGLQVQNYDDDLREGTISQGYFIIGSLGCFVRLPSGEEAILSNNHVLAGENRGQRGNDRILQPGDSAFLQPQHIATLHDFVNLTASGHGATPALGNAVLNDLDVAVATLEPGLQYIQGFLSSRNLPQLLAPASPQVGDHVFKVGRTSGLQYGEVVDVGTTVGPVGYDLGDCWFRQSFTVEGVNGTQFSDQGDSGSAILRTNGEIVGLLYAGNGTQTYCCAIVPCLAAFQATLA
jgi:hypothetical protein